MPRPRAEETVVLQSTPKMHPAYCFSFSWNKLRILREVLGFQGEGGIYASAISRRLKLDAGWVVRCLQEFEGDGIIESTSKLRTCDWCGGSGINQKTNIGCAYCKSTGTRKIKSYPLFYMVSERMLPEIRKFVYACIDFKVRKEELQ